MPRHPLLLVVCFPVSVHSARWVSLLGAGRFRVVVFPSVLQAYCPEFRFSGTIRDRGDVDSLAPGEIGVFDHDLIEPLARSAEERRRGYRTIKSAVDVTPDISPAPSSLRAAILRLQPDLLHSLELQHAGYLCLEAKQRDTGHFPTWLASSWGSDTYLYRKLAVHREQLERLARHIDCFHSDCVRDYASIREAGFKGALFPHVAASGGADLREYPHPHTLAPPSRRHTILVKGYHGWAGRALDILLAIHQVAPQLKGFQIRIMHTNAAVTRMADILRREDGLDVIVDPYYPDLDTAIRRLAEARVVVGYGISDGISTTLLEAMTVGTFCIQANTACGCEWIRPGIDGLEVAPHDIDALAEAILTAVHDDALVDAAVARNRATVEKHWSRPRVAQTVAVACHQLLRTGGA